MRYRITTDGTGQFFLEGTVCGDDVPFAAWMWKQIVGPCASEAEARAFYTREKAVAAAAARTVVWTEGA